MTDLISAFDLVTPFYNLLLAIVVFVLFIKLFRNSKNTKAMVPWKVSFAAFLVYVLEELLTVIRNLGATFIPLHINGFFGLMIITLFIYTLLKQKEISKI